VHTLVVYRPTSRADDALRSLCLAAREHGGRITVLSLAAEEGVSSGCCDTRSVLWNQVCRDFAREYLARADQVVGAHHGNVEFGVLGTRAGRAVDGLLREASARGADEIVLADPRASGLGWFERRRLRLVPYVAAGTTHSSGRSGLFNPRRSEMNATAPTSSGSQKRIVR
jgi:hypothetical protein